MTAPHDPYHEPPRRQPPPFDEIDRAWERWQEAVAAAPAERLAEPGLDGGWSVKDLLGHVAFWDEYAIVRANEFLTGRARAAIDWQGMNEADVANTADNTLDEQRQRMALNHAALLDFLREQTLDDAARAGLLERIRVDTGDHYAEHTAQVYGWLTGDAAAKLPAPFDAIGRAWDGLHRAVAGIPEGRLGEPGVTGAWSVKDLLGHLAYWLEVTTAGIDGVVAGRPRPEHDVQAMNEAEFARGRARSFWEQRARLARAEWAAVRELAGRSLDEATSGRLWEFARDDAVEHFDEHAAEIRAWRGRNAV